MAALNFTPISLYYSTTASAAPSAGNLVAGELALNTLDEKLYFKNSSGVVKLLASNAGSTATVSSVAQTFTGGIVSVAGSPITTSGTLALTVAGTSGGVPYFTSASTWATSALLTQYGVLYGGGAGGAPVATAVGTATHVLTSNGSGVAPTFQAIPASGVTTFTAGTTGFTPSSATSGAVTLAGTLGTANGGTNLGGASPFTSTGVVYASSTSALATSAVFTFDGTNVGVGTSPTSYKFDVSHTLAPLVRFQSNNGNGAYLDMYNGSSTPLYIGFGQTLIAGLSTSDGALRYSNNLVIGLASVEKARFTSSGGFVVGTTTDPGAGIIADINGNVRKVPQSGSSKTTSYTLTTTDVGQYILLGASGAITIPDATFAVGDVVSIFNNTGSTSTITCTITTAYIAGTFTDKATMTLAAAGVATILFITGTTCVVSGNVT